MEAMTLTQRAINDLMAQGYFSEIPGCLQLGSLKDLWIDEMKNRGWDIGVTGDGNDYDLACQESLEQARIRFFSTFHNSRV
jgi:hypothetical protein